jgi:hypothetical protein
MSYFFVSKHWLGRPIYSTYCCRRVPPGAGRSMILESCSIPKTSNLIEGIPFALEILVANMSSDSNKMP